MSGDGHVCSLTLVDDYHLPLINGLTVRRGCQLTVYLAARARDPVATLLHEAGHIGEALLGLDLVHSELYDIGRGGEVSDLTIKTVGVGLRTLGVHTDIIDSRAALYEAAVDKLISISA